MRINRVIIENFGIVGNADINFDECPSLTMLGGRVRTGGASSNGAGKSTVFNAIAWATYGRELRKRAARKVVRRGEKSCRVQVFFTLDDGSKFRVDRSRKRSGGASVKINGKQISTATGGQELIDRTLGFSYDLFVRTVIFGGDLSAFCRMTPAQRTQMLEEMLGIQHYLDASDVAKAAAKEHEEVLSRLEGKIADKRDRRTRAVQAMRSAAENVGGVLIEHEEEVESLRNDVCEHSADMQEALVELAEAYERLAEADSGYERQHAEWVSRCEELQRTLDQMLTERGDVRGKYTSLDSQIRATEGRLAELKRNVRPKFCPTCGKPTDNASKPIDLSKYEADLAAMRKSLVIHAKSRDKAETAVETATMMLKRARADEPKRPDDSPEIDEIRERLVSTESDLKSASRLLRDRLESWDDAKPHREAFNAAWHELLSLDDATDEDYKKVREAKRKLRIMEYWQGGLSRDGIPSLLLDSVAPALNQYVKPLADVLTDRAYSIMFVNSISESGRTDFRVEVSNADGGEDYEDLSKGELVRTDLCVLFAIRELMQTKAKVRCDQIFIDELLDGLDDTGMEYAVRLLRSKKLAKQVVFISHDAKLQEAADGVIVMEKVNGKSRALEMVT